MSDEHNWGTKEELEALEREHAKRQRNPKADDVTWLVFGVSAAVIYLVVCSLLSK